MKDCTDCKKSRGLGSDVWCGDGHPYESYMHETKCPYFEDMHINKPVTTISISGKAKKKMSSSEIYDICLKLKELNLVKEIEQHKYSIKILINCDEDFEEDSYAIRDKIRLNFENEGCRVEILGTYWLDIVFTDVEKMIDNCFK